MSPEAEDERLAAALTAAMLGMSGRQVFLAFQEAIDQQVFPGEPPEDIFKAMKEIATSDDRQAFAASIQGMEQRVKSAIGMAFFHAVLKRSNGSTPTN